MPILYGEGRKAFYRLQEELLKVTTDTSLFTWGYDVSITLLSPPTLYQQSGSDTTSHDELHASFSTYLFGEAPELYMGYDSTLETTQGKICINNANFVSLTV